MEKYLYICQYCSKEYKPNRRKKQKYCSNSCRTRAFQISKYRNSNLSILPVKKSENSKLESMSWSGVGNAAAGTLAINLATKLFTREENKPATKKDLQQVKELLLTRYHPVLNMPSQSNGAKPFYDLDNQQIVYFINRL